MITRRTKYQLRKAEARAHILEGYLIGLERLDEVIDLIRNSDDAETARGELIRRFELSEVQAQAILDLRLARLTGLERAKIQDEYKDLQELIGELRALWADEAKIDGVIREELLEIREIYARDDSRRTEIVVDESDLELEDLIAEETW